ncbi:hypothetical protein BGZ60DRAFT_427703 [Tricladium varicosporioides]|nr:hypothetical protein BGZ60DRAFT_427703 [Hymenoscyphus varicosporioides]
MTPFGYGLSEFGSFFCSTTLSFHEQLSAGGIILTKDIPGTLDLNGAAVMMGDSVSRRNTILPGSSIMIVGDIMQIAAFKLPIMIVGSIIIRIGNSSNISTTPVWESETWKKAGRKDQGRKIVIALEGLEINDEQVDLLQEVPAIREGHGRSDDSYSEWEL